MVTNQRFLLIAIILIIAAGVSLLQFPGFLQTNLFPVNSYHTPNGIVNIRVPIPDAPYNLIQYRVVPNANDTAYFSVNDLEKVRDNVTSVEEVPEVVPKTLEKYGGLPKDAVLVFAETEYLEQFRYSDIPFMPSEVIAKYPISTDVQYGRKLKGVPVTGEGSFIKVILGNDGELLYLNKVWRTVEPAGTEKIIPVSQAIEKLGRGEVLNPLKCICDINVDRIYIAYWEKGAGVQQEYLDPVWVFSGTTSSGDVINYKIYARDDAGSSDGKLFSPSSLHSAPDPGSLMQDKLTSVNGNENSSATAGNQS